MSNVKEFIGILHRIGTLSCSIIRCSPQLARLAVFAIAAMAISAVASAQTILRVDIVSGQENGDGQSWTTAYRFLQDALQEAADNAPDPYDIWVAQGTYRPDQNKGNDACGEGPFDWPTCCPPFGDCSKIAKFVISENIKVYGGFPDDAANTTKYGSQGATDEHRDPKQYVTILSGDLGAEDPDPQSVFVDDLSELYCIDGNQEEQLWLNFKNREDNSIELIWMTGDSATLDGFTVTGAVHVSGAGARLRDCIFAVSEGPALRCFGGSCVQAWRCRLANGDCLAERVIAEEGANVLVIPDSVETARKIEPKVPYLFLDRLSGPEKESMP